MAKITSPRRRKAVGVKNLVRNLRTDELQPNPYNPRKLFDKLPLKTLEESIARVGILVPLTVYKRKSDSQFIILDGQRRWICAQNLELEKVPVNQIEEPTLVQNIVTMFQIHKLREDWELMPTALKLELLMKELQEKKDRELAELTGLGLAMVRRCKILLSYSDEFRERMLDPDPGLRIKTDFFIELYPFLHDRVVIKTPGYPRKSLIKKMLKKYQEKNGGIKAVTDFRKVKQYIANARTAEKIDELLPKLKEFIDNVELTPDYLLIEEADVSAKARSDQKQIQNLQVTLKDLDADAYIGEEDFWIALESLLRTIRKFFEKAGRRIKE